MKTFLRGLSILVLVAFVTCQPGNDNKVDKAAIVSGTATVVGTVANHMNKKHAALASGVVAGGVIVANEAYKGKEAVQKYLNTPGTANVEKAMMHNFT